MADRYGELALWQWGVVVTWVAFSVATAEYGSVAKLVVRTLIGFGVTYLVVLAAAKATRGGSRRLRRWLGTDGDSTFRDGLL